jgi:PelA/Pel-15E family pectate lyase
MRCLNRSLVFFEFLNRKKLLVTGFLLMFLSVNAILGSNFSASADTLKTKKPEAVDLSSFSDGINHALMGYKDKKAPYERYSPEEIDKISENFLVWQNKDGGWPKNIDWLKKYSGKEIEEILQREKDGSKSNSTFDNRNIYSQIEYLAKVYHQTGTEKFAESALRGINYILECQHISGGWRGADVDAITFNDDVMQGIMHLLNSILTTRNTYPFIDDPTYLKINMAFEKGIDCILKCQIRVDGRLTAWCQQHSFEDFKPVWARAFEPPSIASSESVSVVRLLMKIENPSKEIIRAVESAVQWLDKVKINGIRVENVAAEPINFKYHYSDFDRVIVKDENAPPIWSRYYDLEIEDPIFCTRQKVITRNYTDLCRERRTGYAWFTYSPTALIKTDFVKWSEKVSKL